MGAIRDLLRGWLLTDKERSTPFLDLSQWLYDEHTGVSAFRQKVNNHEGRIKTLEYLALNRTNIESQLTTRYLTRLEEALALLGPDQEPRKPKRKSKRKPKK